MGLARSTYYDEPGSAADDTALVEAIEAICDEFERYGYRRVRAALAAARPRRQPQEGQAPDARARPAAASRRRFVATTDSDHDEPIFPNLAKDMVLDGPNQLWVADITYVAIAGGLRLSRGHPRCLVAPRGRLRHRPLDRRPPDARGAEGGDRAATAAAGLHSSLRSRLAICRRALSRSISPSTASSARWAGAAIPTTTPRPRAS